MLLCLNCNSPQPDGTVQCSHCRMKGHFRQLPADGTAMQPSPTAEPPRSAACRNCGADLGGDPERCPQCRFPLRPAQPMSASSLKIGRTLLAPAPPRAVNG